MRTLYSLIILLLLPFAMLKLLVRGSKDRSYLRGWPQRFGILASRSKDKPIWVHAVSVGEVRAVSPLIHQLMQSYPDQCLHISTTTPTGAQMVVQLFGASVAHSYFPYDIPLLVNRYLRRLNPVCVIIVETEIWPNLYHLCKLRNIPLCLINARLSDRSFNRYRFIRPLIKEALNKTVFITAKSEEDRQRFEQLGVSRDNIKWIGNIKFDLSKSNQDDNATNVFLSLLKENQTVWLAVSTHRGEEKKLLEAHIEICGERPDTLLILAPRHPERASEIASLCNALGLQSKLTSTARVPSQKVNVLICDELGMLFSLYPVADVAYIGGSLIPHGGHNPLEAALFSLPILTGPHTWNFDDLYPMLFSGNAAYQVEDCAQLSEKILRLAKNETLRTEMGKAGYNIIESNRGMTKKIASLLSVYIK